MADKDEKQQEDAPKAHGWDYKSTDDVTENQDLPADELPEEPAGPDANSVEWTASEFVAHEKGFGWYVKLAVVAVVITAGIYLATGDAFSVVIVLIMAVIFGVSGSHKPRVVSYKADGSGLTIGSKFYPYAAYKSFSTPQHGPFTTIEMVPLKRLALPVGAFLAPDSQQKVLEIISGHLPMEHGEPGAVDNLMHRLRF